ncbi:hypothetical protein LJC74_03810 [Eubacteriales bacterium OttesenSCG-928-A19]|nr:hypothetical protein [Eubacteriales bacterium OttesenSCG-928-A19]
MNLNEWAKVIHENAASKGWWEEERALPEVLMLCVSELAEALEEYRDRMPDAYRVCDASDNRSACDKEGCGDYHNGKCELDEMNPKPEGVAVEMADCIIRILDYAGHMGWDIEAIVQHKHEYNKTRPWRHGNKLA